VSWSTIVELISVYKRLRAFEAQIHNPDEPAPIRESASPL
jgi:peptide/bleomycin uptake transporter